MEALVVTILERIVDDGVLGTVDIARVMNTSPRTVARWRARERSPGRDAEERILEIKSVVDLLAAYLRPEAARLWIRSPNPNLEYAKPIDVIADGNYLPRHRNHPVDGRRRHRLRGQARRAKRPTRPCPIRGDSLEPKGRRDSRPRRHLGRGWAAGGRKTLRIDDNR